MILRIIPERHSLVISHRDIADYMPAMAMEFPAAPRERLEQLVPGTRVKFNLAVSSRRSAVPRAMVSRLQPVAAPVPYRQPEKPAIGSAIPDFTLTDQQGATVTLSQFRGQVVVINFIYTRCPLPDVCPRLSANFRRLQRRFGNQITLLSITIDPQFDTPEVLRRYAKLWSTGETGWYFLTGTVPRIQAVATGFGLLYFAEEGSMTHTTETAVLDRQGRLAAIVDGPGYAVSQLGDLISAELESK